VKFDWAGPERRRPPAPELRVLEKDGVYGALAALLNDGPIFDFSKTPPTHAPQPEPTLDMMGTLLKAFAPRRSVTRAPAAKSLGEILAPLYSGPLPGTILPPGLVSASPWRIIIPLGTGLALRQAWARGGWPALQYALLWRPWIHGPLDNERSEFVWRVAMTESLMFEHAGFDLAQCDHGRHWYVRKDVRQTDCLRHKRAGQQARWREWAKRRHRRRSRGPAKTA
jgi:hypothetical protein